MATRASAAPGVGFALRAAARGRGSAGVGSAARPRRVPRRRGVTRRAGAPPRGAGPRHPSRGTPGAGPALAPRRPPLPPRAISDDAATRPSSPRGSGPGGPDGDDDPAFLFGLPRAAVAEPLGILLASQFVLFIGVGALLPALPLYAQSIGLDGVANGIVLSAPALAMLALNLPAGKLVDSWGRKQMMMAGMALIAVSDLATSQCRTVAALVPARLSLGAGRSAAEGGDRAYLADLTERFPEARGTITGTQQAVQALGLVIGPAVGGRVAEAHGPTSVFYLISGAALACTAGYSLLPEINAAAEKEERWAQMSVDMSAEEEEAFERELEAIKAASDWRVLMKDDRQRVITFAAAANALGFVAKLTCIPWFATRALDATPAQVGELFSITALLGMASAPAGGWIADRVGLKAVVVTSLAMCAFGLQAAQSAEDVGALQLWIGLWGMGTAAAGPAVNALAQESAPKGGEGEALTLPKTAGDAVFLVGPVVLGALDDRLGSAGASLGLVSATAAASAVAALAFLEPLEEEEEEEGDA